MNHRTAIFFFSAILLSACSSLNGLLEETPPPAAPEIAVPASATAPSDNDAWCQRVAASERARMQALGYDAATLDRMTLAAFQQCRTMAR